MAGDAEIERLRATVSCAVVLEKAGYKLDEKESTRKSMKYRRGAGEIIIVNHDGQGWWDTGSTAKGDVFKLAQHLDPSLNFGQVRRELRGLAGVEPSFPPVERAPRERTEHLPPELRWTTHNPVTEGSRTWAYLTKERGLTPEIVVAASRADVLREGPYGSAWFGHRDGQGTLTGIEMRGPNYRGFSADGEKSLFRLHLGHDAPTRLAVTEAPIDAMSLAALEGMGQDTLYVSTAGGMGPATIMALEQELTALAKRPGAVLVAATDTDVSGERYAAKLTEMATAVNVPGERTAPVGHKDWNDAFRLHAQRRASVMYLSLNQKVPQLAHPEVRQAIKMAIDYEGIQRGIVPNTYAVNQSFLPQGFPGALMDMPFRQDIGAAKALMARVGLADGFDASFDFTAEPPFMDIAQVIQANLAQIGIRLRMNPGDGRQVVSRTRARQHDIAQVQWGSDYFDPNTNAEAFLINTDNVDDARNKTLAWRASWHIPEISARTLAARKEPDAAKRTAMYEELQRESQKDSPFVMLFQLIENSVTRAAITGLDTGPMSDRYRYAGITKA